MKSLRAPSTVYRSIRTASSNLVVYDHHVVAVRTQPSVHGLADATDFVQGWSMVVRPAKVQHLRERREAVSQTDDHINT